MAAESCVELARRKRRQIDLVDEVAELTRQLAEAIDRKDEGAVQMILDLRDEPIREMYAIEEGIRGEYLPGLPAEEARRCDALLSGAAAETPEEEILTGQAALFREKLAPVVELDKQLNIRVGGRKSFYHIYKPNK